MFEFDCLIICEGGSTNHGGANVGYGSYHLCTRDGQQRLKRLDLGTATKQRGCDPAEYLAIITALEDLTGRIKSATESASSYSLLIYTDSQLLAGQLIKAGRQGCQPPPSRRRGSEADEGFWPLQSFGSSLGMVGQAPP